MTKTLFERSILLIAIVFTVFFCATVIPALWQKPDVVAAMLGGFVNPFASGYATDVILCGLVLFCWIAYEAKVYGVRGGWICIPLSLVPGVVVGFALYLVIRERQLNHRLR